MMVEIPLADGLVALVDEEYAPAVLTYRWHATKNANTWYANAYVGTSRKDNRTISMHRLIVKCPKGLWVDHVNHNGLDNRRANLRVATPSQNGGNEHRHKNNKSGCKGVSYDGRRGKKWTAYIAPNGRTRWLGSFDTPEEAAEAYNRAAIEAFGPFALVNE